MTRLQTSRATDDDGKHAHKRRTARMPMGERPADLLLFPPKDRARGHRAVVVDLSAGGARLLTRAYVSPGMACAVLLEELGGKKIKCGGVVRWCDYEFEEGHHVGIEFDEVVDPRRFASEEIINETVRSMLRTDQSISGVILIATGDGALGEAAKGELDDPRLDVQGASSSNEALDMFLERPIDVLITDRTLGTAGEGGEMAGAWRQRGFTGPVMLVGHADDLELEAIASALDASEIIRSPWAPGRLGRSVRDALADYPLRVSDAPIHSAVELIFGTPAPVQRFIERAEEGAITVLSAAKAGQGDAMEPVLDKLSRDSDSAGFPIVGELARQILRNLREFDGNTERVFDQTRRLHGVIGRLAVRGGQG